MVARTSFCLDLLRLVDKSLNVCRGDSVPTLSAIPATLAMSSRDCPHMTTFFHVVRSAASLESSDVARAVFDYGKP